VVAKSEEGRRIKKLCISFLVGFLILIPISGCVPEEKASIGMAVEFNNHAASAYVAHAKGWFEEGELGLLPVFQIYESGAVIAAAFARGDIQIGYIGLTGAIMAYARGVPVKVVAGIHRYGYGLVVSPDLKEVEDLQNKTVGSLREGTVTDLLFNLMISKYRLEDVTILRMTPSEEVIGLITGELDAALIPEQHATMAESRGFPMLIRSQDLWSGMQGDVLVVRAELIRNNPALVERLVKVTQRATAWVNEYPDEAAEIMAEQLQVAGEKMFLNKEAESTMNLEVTPKIISRSMDRIEYSTDINPEVVQDTIDYMVELGYIKSGFNAEDILDLRYLYSE